MEYEICYLIGESKEANIDKIRPIIEQIIEKHKGTFLEGEFVRKRRLSYEIKGEARGTYVARRFTVPSRDERDEMESDYDIMGEINKELRFNQEILRYMLVKTDDLPPLKDLENIEEKNKEQYLARETKRDVKKVVAPVVAKREVKEAVKEAKEEVREDKKEAVEKEVKKEDVKEEAKKEAKVEEVKEAEVKEIKAELSQEKPKKKTKKKEEGILGDDIDEKLDEILNI